MGFIPLPGQPEPALDPLGLAHGLARAAVRINDKLLERAEREREAMRMRWFGKTWYAPINELEHMPTPVGERCMLCATAIEEQDRGLMLPSLVRDSVKGHDLSAEPAHLFCFLQNTLGKQTARNLYDELQRR